MGLEQSSERNHGSSLPSWRYTIQTMSIENRTIKIDEDNYHFRKELGSGAFGSVYAARRASDGTPVAVKVVSLATLTGAQADVLAKSILNEIQMAKRLAKASKHVVHMYAFDFHQRTGLAFLVMELGEKDFEKALKERGRISSLERKAFWRQLVEIAIVLNNHDIVHLDIKPPNLVVFPNNRIKLVDLGIAQKAYKRTTGRNGTWLYSAPEVTTASRNQTLTLTSKSDVWSWGAVLYRMTYYVPPGYDPPCHHPPKGQTTNRDPTLVDVLRHTLVIDPKKRADAKWMAYHQYTLP